MLRSKSAKYIKLNLKTLGTKCGTKKPRKNDYLPASDSVLGQSQIDLRDDSFRIEYFNETNDILFSLNSPHKLSSSTPCTNKTPTNKTPNCKVTFDETPTTKISKVDNEKSTTGDKIAHLKNRGYQFNPDKTIP